MRFETRVREVDSAEFGQIVDLQREAWDFAQRDIVGPTLLTVFKEKGILLGICSINDPRTLLGFVLGFSNSGGDVERAIHATGAFIPHHLLPPLHRYSDSLETQDTFYVHMVGVRNNLKGYGLGEELMQETIERLSRLGISAIELTFDPLLSRNARLFIHKFNARIVEYRVDYYGDFTGVYRGKPSDRFIARIDLGGVHTQSCDPYYAINEQSMVTTITPVTIPTYRLTFRKITSVCLGHTASPLFVEIPVTVDDPRVRVYLRDSEKNLLYDLRMKTREVFTHYLTHGYSVIDFLTLTKDGQLRGYYVLTRGGLIE